VKTVLPIGFFEPFTPEIIDAMQAAFTEACRTVGCEGNGEALETIALHIINTAQRGIHDPAVLRDEAIAHWRRLNSPTRPNEKVFGKPE
jgi:hypothetical protein